MPSTKRLEKKVAALAADPHVAKKNGGLPTAWQLSEEYGFTDIGGSRPERAILDAAFEEARKTHLAGLIESARFAVVDWKLAPKSESTTL
jgi:hypothetical protein